MEGTATPILYKGQPVIWWVDEHGTPVAEGTPGARLSPLVIREYSDTLLIFMLKALAPEKYRERYNGPQTGRNGGAIEHRHQPTPVGLPSPEEMTVEELDKRDRIHSSH
jgi:hypothetical protein